MEQVRLHRQKWTLERIASDPAGFRADCERLLIGFPMPDNHELSGEWPDHWLDLLFSDPPPQRLRTATQCQ